MNNKKMVKGGRSMGQFSFWVGGGGREEKAVQTLDSKWVEVHAMRKQF